MGSVFKAAVEGLPLKGRALQATPLFALEKGDRVNSLLRIEGKGNGKAPSNGDEDSAQAAAPEASQGSKTRRKSTPEKAATTKESPAKKAVASAKKAAAEDKPAGKQAKESAKGAVKSERTGKTAEGHAAASEGKTLAKKTAAGPAAAKAPEKG